MPGQKLLTTAKILEKLELLSSRLPSRATAVAGAYELPEDVRRRTSCSVEECTELLLQEISNHIGYFLGILTSVRVIVVDLGHVSNQPAWLVSPTGSVVGQASALGGVSGVYEVSRTGTPQITVFARHHLRTNHIIAILAHEATHHYLRHHAISLLNSDENEVLTDLGAAYLGLGGLLLDGYSPIVCPTPSGEATLTLGYVAPASIRSAVRMSALLRSMPELGSSLPWMDRMGLRFSFWRRQRACRKEKQRIKSLHTQLLEARNQYEDIQRAMDRIGGMASNGRIGVPEDNALVEIANELFAGNTRRSLDAVTRQAKGFLINNIPPGEATELHREAERIVRKIGVWHNAATRP